MKFNGVLFVDQLVVPYVMLVMVAVQVDMRYRSINDSTYSIAVQLNGYYIATVSFINVMNIKNKNFKTFVNVDIFLLNVLPKSSASNVQLSDIGRTFHSSHHNRTHHMSE